MNKGVYPYERESTILSPIYTSSSQLYQEPTFNTAYFFIAAFVSQFIYST